MSDAGPTAQRAAARSSLALAAHVWTCREDPAIWNQLSFLGEMEVFLRQSKVRFLGDAFWLVEGLLVREEERQAEDRAEVAGVRGPRFELTDRGGEMNLGPLEESAEHFQREAGEVDLFVGADLRGLGATPR